MKQNRYLIVMIIMTLAIILNFLQDRGFISLPQWKTDEESVSNTLPKPEQENDKIMVLEGIGIDTTRMILRNFCSMYNKEDYKILPRLHQVTDDQLALTFPCDITQENLSLFMQYLKDLPGVHQKPEVMAWATMTVKGEDSTKKSVDKKIMLFIKNDEAGNKQVYATTEDNKGLILLNANENHWQETPVAKTYIPPSVKPHELYILVSEDFQ